jgi:hypothetical protein
VDVPRRVLVLVRELDPDRCVPEIPREISAPPELSHEIVDPPQTRGGVGTVRDENEPADRPATVHRAL